MSVKGGMRVLFKNERKAPHQKGLASNPRAVLPSEQGCALPGSRQQGWSNRPRFVNPSFGRLMKWCAGLLVAGILGALAFTLMSLLYVSLW
jgi:hypothetical protein